MAKKKVAVNLSLPTLLRDEFGRRAAPLGPKGKWMLHTAAMLALLDLPPKVLDYYFTEIDRADGYGGSFEELIDRAHSGGLRDDAYAAAEKAKGALTVLGGKAIPNPKPDRLATEGTLGRRPRKV